ASKMLDAENRSAVQIPDPFLEKLLLEATMEAVRTGCVKGIKDLGGGGLSCCLSETSDSLGKGFDVELSNVNVREGGMTPAELMISESQERMLYVTSTEKLPALKSVLDKYEIRYSILGTVQEHQDLVVRNSGGVVASMPSHLVAHAPLAERASRRPKYLDALSGKRPAVPSDLGKALLSLLADPTIASKRWVYNQYDNEVGIRTVIKPGMGDAAVLRLDTDDRLVAIKLDGNSKHCYLDPYQGTLGCLSEGRRNVICTGAEPIGVVDHLQFASPENPEVFWTFTQAVKAIIDYCKFIEIPVVGGKVSFYNETAKGPIKPSIVMGTLGLIEDLSHVTKTALASGDSIFIVGHTFTEMGGSEYYEYVHGITGGAVPKVDLEQDRRNGDGILKLIRKGLARSVHDCSKGGLAIALAEMAIAGKTGLKIDSDTIPNSCKSPDDLLFSESNSRYIVATSEPDKVRSLLSSEGVVFAQIGRAEGTTIEFSRGRKRMINLPLGKAEASYYSLEETMK
ncbi:MAG TPA: AIR synthase-related protein, partial [Nitrososphaera sp.]